MNTMNDVAKLVKHSSETQHSHRGDRARLFARIILKPSLVVRETTGSAR